MLFQRQRSLLRIKGFTAIELLVAIAVLAVLVGLAAPSFTPVIERWRVRQATEELQSTLYLARSEAVKRSGGVAIIQNGNSGECTSETAQWNCGWTVFLDANNNGTLDRDEVTLQSIAAPLKVTIKFTDSSGGNLTGAIQVDRWGHLSSGSSAAFSFRLIPKGQSDSQSNTASLCVGSGGRIKQLDTGNGTCA